MYHPSNTLMTFAADIGEDRQIELQKMVDKFIKSDETSMTFPSSLSNQDRLYLHQVAQKANLKHNSTGSGVNRKLTLTKQVNVDSYFVNVNADPRAVKPLGRALHVVKELDMRTSFKLQSNPSFHKERNSASQYGYEVRLCQGVPPFAVPDSSVSRFRQKLPIHSYRSAVLESITCNQVSLIAAETGAGKTTQVPQYLLEWHSLYSDECLILCSQPRRLAAMSSAERIAHERNEPIGQTVGYCVKLENRMSEELTRLLFCTTGTLLRMLIMDSSLLYRVTHLVIDEVHERDRFTDFLLCIVKRFCERNKKLTVVLMSASMNEKLLSDYFNKCPVVRVPGRMFPVQQFFLEHILLKLKEVKKKKEKQRQLLDSEDVLNDLEELQLSETIPEDGTNGLSFEARLVSVSNINEKRISNYSNTSEGSHVTDTVGGSKSSSENVELIRDSFFVYDEETEEAVEMNLDDIDNLLLLFFHTVTMEAFELILKLINNSTIKVDHQHSESGLTVLMIACAHGKVDLVHSLLKMGASPHLTDQEGKTAVDYAVHNQHYNVEHILNEYSKLIEVAEDEEAKEEGSTLVDEYVRSCSMETENVDHDLIMQVIIYIVSDFTAPEFDNGAILVFLPGYEEISRMKILIEEHDVLGDQSNFRVFVLHSNIKSEDQKRVFQHYKERKLILSTNIAETSLTIDDVIFVVDPGKTKQREMDTQSSLSYSLQVCWASQANVKQRAGRAGRTRPGYAFHLFSKTRFESMKDFTSPEILRYPLNDLCLQTKIVFPDNKHSISDILTSVPDAPPQTSITSALKHLKEIGALDSNEKMTSLGNFLVKMPLDPDLARMVLYSLVFRCLDPVCIIAATLAYRSPFYLPPSKRLIDEAERKRKKLSFNSQSDHFVLLFAFLTWSSYISSGKHAKADEFCYSHHLSAPVLQVIDKSRLQIIRHLVSQRVIKNPKSYVYYNSNAQLTSCVRASIFAAFAHSTVLYDTNRGKYCADWSNNLKIHRASAILQSAPKLPSCLCCDEITRGVGQPMVKSATAVNPIMLLLLSNTIESIESATDDFCLFRISKTVQLTCDRKLSDIILEARKAVRHIVVSMTEGAYVNKEFQCVMDCLIDVLESAEPPEIGYIPPYQNFYHFGESLFEGQSQYRPLQNGPGSRSTSSTDRRKKNYYNPGMKF
ncbi:uncharacterized protein LOC134843680 isoform X2 [Symsagittifera roscoffensis]|uniref:uncharacterized protein LOC134843680 isoform X2 n=1 Tax=Symsagittifera roscoffensis TaxID=84072 RepID=UPI00307B910B